MKTTIWVLSLFGLIVAAKAVFIWSGAYNIAADEPHWRLTERVLKTVRDRSIAVRASGIMAPDLDDQSLVRDGAGNYDAMCAGCHLKPGVQTTELSNGLYPAPPELASHRNDNPAVVFRIIKHGVKMSGMPAWGKSMDDESIWGMVAFLKRLPDMSEASYRELVESSEGHTHGPGHEEATTHVHPDGAEHEHH